MKIKQTLWSVKLRPENSTRYYLRMDEKLPAKSSSFSVTLEQFIVSLLYRGEDRPVGKLVPDLEGNPKNKYSVQCLPLSCSNREAGVLRCREIAKSNSLGSWICYEGLIDSGRDNAFQRTSDPTGGQPMDISSTYQVRGLRMFLLFNPNKRGFWVSMESMSTDSPIGPYRSFLDDVLKDETGLDYEIETEQVSDPALMLEYLHGYNPKEISVDIPKASTANYLRCEDRERRTVGVSDANKKELDKKVRNLLSAPSKKKLKKINKIIDRSFIVPVTSAAANKKIIYEKIHGTGRVTINLAKLNYDISNYWEIRPASAELIAETENLLKHVSVNVE